MKLTKKVAQLRIQGPKSKSPERIFCNSYTGKIRVDYLQFASVRFSVIEMCYNFQEQ